MKESNRSKSMNNYCSNDFLKQLDINIKFMNKLEQGAEIKNKNIYTIVPMHKLTNHKLILDYIKDINCLYWLPDKILYNRFYFEIKTDDLSKEAYNGIHLKDKILFWQKEKTNKIILSFKIRYFLLFDAASKEHQKQSSKITGIN